MIDLIEGRLDVKLHHPVILPASLSGDGNCLFRRSKESPSTNQRIARIGVRVVSVPVAAVGTLLGLLAFAPPHNGFRL